MKIQRRRILGAAAATLLGAPSVRAAAPAGWPTKPVRLIVPNVPGGGIDILARLMQGELQKIWGQQILVDYKPGAGTVLGTDFVAKSAPDGYTLGMVVTSHVINPSLRSKMPYDTLKDLSGVGMTAVSSMLLSVSPKVPVNSLKEFIEYAKARPGKISYATPGAGSSMHMSGELLKLQTGIDMLHVPYKGSGAAYSDVFDGRVDMLIDPTFASMVHVRSGRLKPLAVLSAKRDSSAPDVPAIGETMPGFNVQSMNGIVVPAGTPRDLVQKISADFARALRSEELKARLLAVGLEPVGSTPAEFDTYVRTELKRWEGVVKKAKISLE
jgi:tripartite-type tricarboxylate transporter receptor subunit TctC